MARSTSHVCQLNLYLGTACFVLNVDSTVSYFRSYKMQVQRVKYTTKKGEMKMVLAYQKSTFRGNH